VRTLISAIFLFAVDLNSSLKPPELIRGNWGIFFNSWRRMYLSKLWAANAEAKTTNQPRPLYLLEKRSGESLIKTHIQAKMKTQKDQNRFWNSIASCVLERSVMMNTRTTASKTSIDRVNTGA